MADVVEGEWKNFIFKKAEPEDYPKILEHMRNNFYHDEPLNVLTGFSDEKAADMDEMVLTYFKDELSFFILEKGTDKVVGARITAEHRRNASESVLEMKSKEMKKIFPFLMKLDEESKVFETFPSVDRYAELFMASVDREFRGQGLATEMYVRAIALLKTKGFKLAKSSFTSPYTQKIAIKMGFRELARLYFKDHKDENGEFAFPNAGEDECAVAGVLEL